MSNRRRGGQRWKRTRKVKREEMVRFYQRAEAKKAERRATILAGRIWLGIQVLAGVVALVALYRALA